jgi:hypothetical protein
MPTVCLQVKGGVIGEREQGRESREERGEMSIADAYCLPVCTCLREEGQSEGRGKRAEERRYKMYTMFSLPSRTYTRCRT